MKFLKVVQGLHGKLAWLEFDDNRHVCLSAKEDPEKFTRVIGMAASGEPDEAVLEVIDPMSVFPAHLVQASGGKLRLTDDGQIAFSGQRDCLDDTVTEQGLNELVLAGLRLREHDVLNSHTVIARMIVRMHNRVEQRTAHLPDDIYIGELRRTQSALAAWIQADPGNRHLMSDGRFRVMACPTKRSPEAITVASDKLIVMAPDRTDLYSQASNDLTLTKVDPGDGMVYWRMHQKAYFAV